MTDTLFFLSLTSISLFLILVMGLLLWRKDRQIDRLLDRLMAQAGSLGAYKEAQGPPTHWLDLQTNEITPLRGEASSIEDVEGTMARPVTEDSIDAHG